MFFHSSIYFDCHIPILSSAVNNKNKIDNNSINECLMICLNVAMNGWCVLNVSLMKSDEMFKIQKQ